MCQDMGDRCRGGSLVEGRVSCGYEPVSHRDAPCGRPNRSRWLARALGVDPSWSVTSLRRYWPEGSRRARAPELARVIAVSDRRSSRGRDRGPAPGADRCRLRRRGGRYLATSQRARGGIRTRTPFRTVDFESTTSAIPSPGQCASDLDFVPSGSDDAGESQHDQTLDE